VLFQHLFWFYSHPAVYVFVLPGLGVISELLPVFVRKPLFGYRWVAMSSLGSRWSASWSGRTTCSPLA
jgi:cytochrome c oxidase subunit I